MEDNNLDTESNKIILAHIHTLEMFLCTDLKNAPLKCLAIKILVSLNFFHLILK